MLITPVWWPALLPARLGRHMEARSPSVILCPYRAPDQMPEAEVVQTGCLHKTQLAVNDEHFLSQLDKETSKATSGDMIP